MNNSSNNNNSPKNSNNINAAYERQESLQTITYHDFSVEAIIPNSLCVFFSAFIGWSDNHFNNLHVIILFETK